MITAKPSRRGAPRPCITLRAPPHRRSPRVVRRLERVRAPPREGPTRAGGALGRGPPVEDAVDGGGGPLEIDRLLGHRGARGGA
eukprot:4498901-Prymnesium_polylepis.1